METVIAEGMKRAESVLFKYGVATLIAVGLTSWLALSATNTLNSINDKITTHIQETGFYMRQVCINTSQSEAQRSSCFPETRH